MNQSQFNISLGQAIKLTKRFNLFKSIGVKPVGGHSSIIKKVSKRHRHTDIYKVAIDNFDYEILLNDDSIFQFSLDKDVRYAFIQNPNNFVTKEDYLSEIFSPDELMSFSDIELGNLLDTIDEKDYQQYLNEQELNISANYIRYDAGELGYKPLVHSFSHLHIGMNEHLRIPCSRVLTPLKFVIFCLKNTYYKIWKDFIYFNSDFENEILQYKSLCNNVNPSFWKKNEESELFLS